MVKITRDVWQTLQRITVENDELRFSFLPEVGGKLVSLVGKPTHHEYIWQSGRPFQKVPFGANYMDHDISGLDECFPSIAEGFYPDYPWKGVPLADHGEVWTLPWQCDTVGEELMLGIHGVRFPYHFQKKISLQGNSIRFDYTLTNKSPFDFKYIWALHPMLTVTAGTRILLPGQPRIRLNWSKHERVGKLLYETTWPIAQTASGEKVDLSVMHAPDLDQATKFFTTALPEGWCGLHDPKTGDYFKMSFPADKVPYVGVWINEGGWPFNGPPAFQMAFEPSTGCPDRLETAIERGECACVSGNGQVTWNLVISVGKSMQLKW